MSYVSRPSEQSSTNVESSLSSTINFDEVLLEGSRHSTPTMVDWGEEVPPAPPPPDPSADVFPAPTAAADGGGAGGRSRRSGGGRISLSGMLGGGARRAGRNR